MKLSDYLAGLIKELGCEDIFGYQGGMISHFVDSIGRDGKIRIHTLLNEQSCGFAACGYAQAGNKVGWVFTSSGPGATNLLTAICHAYYDSVPVVFITGQVNTTEAKGKLNVRQKAFQETDIVSVVENVTKRAYYVCNPLDIKRVFEEAVSVASEGRKGPVLIDLPMDIQRADICISDLRSYAKLDVSNKKNSDDIVNIVSYYLQRSNKPVLLLGNGVKTEGQQAKARELVNRLGIPAVSSMLACDVLQNDCPYNYGFVGAYGHRWANFILAKCDLIISIGSRLDVRQIGGKKENFAPNAKLIRFDIDADELENRIKTDEIQIVCELSRVFEYMDLITTSRDYTDWLSKCEYIRHKLCDLDYTVQNNIISRISASCSDVDIIAADVGQNQVWVAQSFKVREGQTILFSGGHGSMGFSLPAAIGAYYAVRKPLICFCGDGGLQMTIQEFQYIKAFKIPITIFVFNNHSLGMIRHFQEMYFEGRYIQTTNNNGYSVPDFKAIAKAYGIRSMDIEEYWNSLGCSSDEPIVVNIELEETTYIWPKLEFGKPNQDQEPLIDRILYNELMEL